jgi:cytochrome c oxidase assembly protein subunit 15
VIRTITPQRYRTITRIALWSLVVIVVSGAAVRLTGSGLGCSDWPNCSAERFVPEREFHGLVEFVNRMFTGAVSVAVILAVLASRFRQPRRRDLTILSWGLVVGVLIQIVLGGITVLTHLRPEIVMAHFLLSMVLVLNAVVLEHRAGNDDAMMAKRGEPRHSFDQTWARSLVGLTALVVFLGTMVTAAGPHAGDEEVERLGVDLGTVARIHGASVWVLLASLAVFFVVRRSRDPDAAATRRLEQFALVVLAQGTIGYVQYFNDTPALLVGLHIVGACAVWISIIRLALLAHDQALPVELPRRELLSTS